LGEDIMASTSANRDLFFGLMALENNFIDRDMLVGSGLISSMACLGGLVGAGRSGRTSCGRHGVIAPPSVVRHTARRNARAETWKNWSRRIKADSQVGNDRTGWGIDHYARDLADSCI
jgi:hypothetical protein